MEITCLRVKSEDVAVGYLLGTLDKDVREAYEQHIFDCPECLDDFETLRVTQHELEATRENIEAAASARRVRPTSIWALRLVAAAVVIGAAALLVGPLVNPKQIQVVSAGLAELARIEPAPYSPVTLRGTTGEASDAFQEAMAHYLAGDYETAAQGLQAAAELNPESPRIGFYLGVSLLLTGQTEAAIESFKEAIALGDSLYLEMAHFFLAKAHLLNGDVEAARGQLEKTRDLEGDLETEAERLLGLIPTLGETPG
jgi:TolA-binding protein